MEIISESPEQTLELGQKIGEQSSAGDIFFLSGELGGGKTLFTKGLAVALQLPKNSIISPSFTLILEHPQGTIPLYHMDLYRLSQPQEIEDLGLEMYCHGQGIVVIEWANRMKEALPTPSLEIDFQWQEEHSRRITIHTDNALWKDKISGIMQ